MYINNWFGDIDASRDKDLFDCFTELTSHTDALEKEIYSIRAFKGAGKTAFLRHLEHCAKKPSSCQNSCPLSSKTCEAYSNLLIIPVNATEISFETLQQNLVKYTDPRYEMTKVLRVILKSYFVIKFHSYVNEIYPEDEQIFFLDKKIKNNGLLNKAKGAIREIVKVAERAFTEGDSFTDYLSNQLFTENIDTIYDLCFKIMDKKQIHAIIILDQFDDIIDLFKNPGDQRFYYHQTVATSLLKLSYDDSTYDNEDNFPNELLQVKCLFPEDLYSILEPRDLQKYDMHTISLKWDSYALNDFIAKRIAKLLNIEFKDEEKLRIFNKLMSKTLYNNFYKITENSFDYLLRHTLFRPRDLQQIFVSIVSELVKKRKIKSKSEFIKHLPLQPDHIKEGVKKGTIFIIKYLNIEFEALNLQAILSTLRNKPNINTYGDFYNYIKKSNIDFNTLDVTNIIKKLWEIGVIGLFLEGNSKITETYRNFKVGKYDSTHYVSLFTFSWRNDYDFAPDDKVVISPLFYDYLDSKVDEKMIIYPF